MSSLLRTAIRICVVLVVVQLALLAPHTPIASAQTEAVVSVGSIEIGEGLTGAVVVTVADVQGLYGADVQLEFEQDKLQVVDSNSDQAGVQIVLGDFLSNDLVIRNVADNEAGTVHFAGTQLNPAEAKSGSGELFSVVFRGLRAGTTANVTIASATLANRSGQEIPATAVDSVVEVVASELAPPTPTPAPVAQPTLILPTASFDNRATPPTAVTDSGQDGASATDSTGAARDSQTARTDSAHATSVPATTVDEAASSGDGSEAAGATEESDSAGRQQESAGVTATEDSVASSPGGSADGEQAAASGAGNDGVSSGSDGAKQERGGESQPAADNGVEGSSWGTPQWAWLILIVVVVVLVGVVVHRRA